MTIPNKNFGIGAAVGATAVVGIDQMFGLAQYSTTLIFLRLNGLESFKIKSK